VSDDKQIDRPGASRQADRGDGSVPGDVLRVMRILHGALTASILFYAVFILMVIRPAGDPVPGADIPARSGPPDVLFPIMVAVAAAILVVLMAVRRRMARRRDAAAGVTTEQAPIDRSAQYRDSIISWALCEGIAIVGLVVGIAHRSLTPFAPFLGVSLLLMLLLAPRRSHFQ
jgi:hypothetical protein